MSGTWDPWRAELDTGPRDPALGSTSWIVCATPRSGSGLLCRGLAAGGLAGVPAEYFNPRHREPLAQRWGTGDRLSNYVMALRARRSSPDGVFTTKLHWDQLVELRAQALGVTLDEPRFAISDDFLAALFGGARYVRIVRLDVDRQAISLWTAMRRGVWSLRAGAPVPAAAAVPVPYDFAAIERCRRWILSGEVHWERFVRANAIAPVEVVYERLIRDYAGTVAATLTALLGRTIEPASIPPPDSIAQTDALSDDLLARFLADRARLGHGPSTMPDSARSVLASGESVGAGVGLMSPDAGHRLVVGGDGRLIVERRGDARWQTTAHGTTTAHLEMQSDGDLVLADDDGRVLWSAGTAGNPGARAELQDDGQMVVRATDDRALWHTALRP